MRGFIGDTHMQRGAIGVRVNSDTGDSCFPQRPNNPYCNLAPIGDQHLSKRHYSTAFNCTDSRAFPPNFTTVPFASTCFKNSGFCTEVASSPGANAIKVYS